MKKFSKFLSFLAIIIALLVMPIFDAQAWQGRGDCIPLWPGKLECKLKNRTYNCGGNDNIWGCHPCECYMTNCMIPKMIKKIATAVPGASPELLDKLGPCGHPPPPHCVLPSIEDMEKVTSCGG